MTRPKTAARVTDFRRSKLLGEEYGSGSDDGGPEDHRAEKPDIGTDSRALQETTLPPLFVEGPGPRSRMERRERFLLATALEPTPRSRTGVPVMRATLSLSLLGAAVLTLGALALRLTRGEGLLPRPRIQRSPQGPDPRSLPERLRERGL